MHSSSKDKVSQQRLSEWGMLDNKRTASFWRGINLKMCRASSVTGESKGAGLLGYFQQKRTILLGCPVFCMYTIYQRWQQEATQAEGNPVMLQAILFGVLTFM